MANIDRPDDPQMLSWSSPRNISMRGTDESGYTRAEWAELTDAERAEVESELIWELIEIYPTDEESGY